MSPEEAAQLSFVQEKQGAVEQSRGQSADWIGKNQPKGRK